MATVTVRLVRSFEYRTIKLLVLRDVPLDTITGAELKLRVRERVRADASFAPYRAHVGEYDALKIHQATRFSHKGQDLVVDTLHDDWWIADDDVLAAKGVEHEAELSMFRRADYDAYVASGAARAECKW